MVETTSAAGSSKGANTTSQNDPILSRIDAASFNWDAFQGPYRGRALISRLIHIPNLILQSPTPSPQSLDLAKTTLLRLIPLLKKSTWDHTTHLHVISQLRRTLHPGTNGTDGDGENMEGGEENGIPDMEWVDEVRENERKEAGRLDVELRGYMSNLIKESIRLTYFAFAQLALKGGNSSAAMRHYSSAREYSTSPQHHLDLGLHIVNLCIQFNNPTTLPGHISKLETSLDRVHPPPPPSTSATNRTDTNASMTATDVRDNREKEARALDVRKHVGVRMRVARGLVSLGNRDYREAGREMGEVGEEGGLGEWDGLCISTADIALITAMCTLATGSRDQIRRVLLDRASFRSAVDDSQGWVLELVNDFMDADYGGVSAILKSAEPTLLLNPFLSPHVQTLSSLIQKDSIVQYVLPYSNVRIAHMATAFGMGLEQMVGQVERLVQEGEIRGRIDLIDLVLELKETEPRNEVFASALKTGVFTSENTQGALFRMKLHEARITVDPRPNEAKGFGAPMGPTDSLELDPDEGFFESRAGEGGSGVDEGFGGGSGSGARG